MNELTHKRNEPQSPCVSTCIVHPIERMCIGCLRHIDEISNWSSMGKQERDRILAELPNRTVKLVKKGKRHTRTSNG